ncbi:hypothetical protein NLM27_15110 [Bradyrhizobium sp. CCGB12]|uniref:hypothetical protein n=1 Tax=Bradyrhizobium sp. CCGB12 TaxID=2949632 RepID=UPI0020B3E1A7|nr:hypothetical protein [Bradyrhizobium sp. CCGB12]MCP3390106.1 hypothetical protein [Bradyrhizobium sp. CCGB12]
MKLSARMVLSPNRGRRCAVDVVKLITMGGFARDAPKAENGFIFVRIVSWHSGRRNIRPKSPIISDGPRSGPKPPDKFLFKLGGASDAGAVTRQPHALHTHFTFFC